MNRGTSRRCGAVGASFSGSSSRAAWKRNIWALVKAKDILRVHELGLHEIGLNVLDVCRIATESPSLLYAGQKGMIGAVWQDLAEAGKLRGIRAVNMPQHEGNEELAAQETKS